MVNQPKKFQRKVEDFICEKCGTKNIGNGFTNHCFKCLWSKHVDINPGDVFLMCTDGLTNKLEDYEIDNIIVEFENLNNACIKLVELANNRGGEDNVTVILISLRGK